MAWTFLTRLNDFAKAALPFFLEACQLECVDADYGEP